MSGWLSRTACGSCKLEFIESAKFQLTCALKFYIKNSPSTELNGVIFQTLDESEANNIILLNKRKDIKHPINHTYLFTLL